MDSDAGHAPAIGASSIGTRRLYVAQKDSARERAGWDVGMMITYLAQLESGKPCLGNLYPAEAIGAIVEATT